MRRIEFAEQFTFRVLAQRLNTSYEDAAALCRVFCRLGCMRRVRADATNRPGKPATLYRFAQDHHGKAMHSALFDQHAPLSLVESLVTGVGD